MKGNYTEAISNYEEALKVEPNDPITLRYIAMDLITTGKHPKAATYLTRLLAINPSDVEAQQLLRKLSGTKAL